LIAGARVYRYQYFHVVGPASSTNLYAQGDFHRVDRSTGYLQAWVCTEVDTAQVARVPPPPKPSDYDNQDTADSGKTTPEYFIALSLWRKAFPHVNPESLYVTKTVCGWESAQ
jgi:hypothetical protein